MPRGRKLGVLFFVGLKVAELVSPVVQWVQEQRRPTQENDQSAQVVAAPRDDRSLTTGPADSLAQPAPHTRETPGTTDLSAHDRRRDDHTRGELGQKTHEYQEKQAELLEDAREQRNVLLGDRRSGEDRREEQVGRHFGGRRADHAPGQETPSATPRPTYESDNGGERSGHEPRGTDRHEHRGASSPRAREPDHGRDQQPAGQHFRDPATEEPQQSPEQQSPGRQFGTASSDETLQRFRDPHTEQLSPRRFTHDGRREPAERRFESDPSHHRSDEGRSK